MPRTGAPLRSLKWRVDCRLQRLNLDVRRCFSGTGPKQVKESKLSVSLCRDRKRAPFRVPVPATASSGDGSSTGFATAKSSGSPAWARARAARADKAAKRLLPCSTRLSSPKELLLPQGISTGEVTPSLPLTEAAPSKGIFTRDGPSTASAGLSIARIATAWAESES